MNLYAVPGSVEGENGRATESEVLAEAEMDLFTNDQGGDDKELRDNELAYRKRPAQADTAGAAGGAIVLILEDLYGVEAREQEGRVGARQDGEGWDQQREEEKAAGMLEPIGMEVLRDKTGEGFDEHRGERHREKGGEQYDEECLAEELADEPPAGAPHGFANADLFCAAGGLGRGEIDKIDRRQEQEEGGDGQQAV